MIRDLHQNLSSNFDKHLVRNQKIVIGVSGGEDSVALLTLLINSELNLQITVCHFNHLLRGDSSFNDEIFVKELCKKHSLKLYTKRLNILRASSLIKKGIEETSRIFRRKFFEEILYKSKSSLILLAHHSNDQVETFFMRLLRGASLKGLESMKILDYPYYRPLLGSTKEMIRSYSIEKKIEWVNDSSNSDDRYTRNNIRKNLIPLLSRINPNLSTTISRTIKMIADQNLFTQQHISNLSNIIIKPISNYEFTIKLYDFNELTSFEKSEILYSFFSKKINSDNFISYQNIRDLISLAESPKASAEFYLTQNIKAEKGYGYLLLQIGVQNSKKINFQISKEGSWESNDLFVTVKKDNFEEDVDYKFFNLTFPDSNIRVRNYQDGDRIRLKGQRSKKLKDIFIAKKVPKFLRYKLPVFEVSGEIFYIYGLKINSDFQANPSDKESIGIAVKSNNLEQLINEVNF